MFADMNNDGQLDMIAVSPFGGIGAVVAHHTFNSRFEVLPEESGFSFPVKPIRLRYRSSFMMQ